MRSARTTASAALVAAALLLALGAWYEWSPSRTPPGQPPLTVVTGANLKAFEARFNAYPQDPRLLLLFSPT